MYLIFTDTPVDEQNSLRHYRVGGEKKGVRRWQNEDRTLTPAGREHYAEMYGWGKKDEAKGEPVRSSKSGKTETDHNSVRKELATDVMENDQKTRKSAKISAKLFGGSAGTFATTWALFEGGKAFKQAMYDADKFISNLPTDSSALGRAISKLAYGGTLRQIGRTVKNITTSRLMTDIGAVLGLAAGAITVAGVAAFYKIRSSLGKRKIAKDVLDEVKTDIKHSDDELTYNEVFDSMTDQQKFIVIYLIDQALKYQK